MGAIIGRNTNTCDTAFHSGAIATNITTSVKILDANPLRIFFCVNNDNAQQGVWIKLQAAALDDDKKGIFLPAKSAWQMPSDNIYTGEICAIANVGTPDVYVTQY